MGQLYGEDIGVIVLTILRGGRFIWEIGEMIFAGTSISEIAGAMGRTWRNMRSADTVADAEFDPYEAVPAERADIAVLLDTEIDGAETSEPTPEEEALRASEKLEYETMCVIRGALYPVDQD